MADTLTPPERSLRMSKVKGKNTKPELIVRSLIHQLGFRFRLHAKDLPGNPDLVFRSSRKAIFVHGCFWHRHDDPTCKLSRLPKSRLDFWLPKLEANQRRDTLNIAQLQAQEWHALVIWECQLRDRQSLEQQIKLFLGDTR